MFVTSVPHSSVRFSIEDNLMLAASFIFGKNGRKRNKIRIFSPYINLWQLSDFRLKLRPFLERLSLCDNSNES